MKGLYCLEEYYAKNLDAYYAALSVGPSHNYYEGRAAADITEWIGYFCAGMAKAFTDVERTAASLSTTRSPDYASLLRTLDPLQRRTLDLLTEFAQITSQQVSMHLKVSEQAARRLCAQWVASGFLDIANTAKKKRSYRLAQVYERVLF